MRRWWVLGVLLARLAGAGTTACQPGDTSCVTCVGQQTVPGHPCLPASKAVGFATAGRVRCSPFRLACGRSFTTIGFTTTADTGYEYDLAIVQFDGANHIVFPPVVETGPQVSPGIGAGNVTLATVYGLQANALYYVCVATSDAASAFKVDSCTGDTVNDFGNGSGFRGATTLEVDIVQFNSVCTAAGAPYICCTGLATGTCLGTIPATITMASNPGQDAPLSVLVP
jgi:hypothetical protein